MGGRGSKTKAAAAALKAETPNEQHDLEAELRRLGFKNAEDAKQAEEVRKFVHGHKDAGDVVEHVMRHGGSLGPIMLRIGLPRNKLLDIVHALKPLHDHGILTMQLPFSFKHYQDPFAAAHAARSGGEHMVSTADIETALLQMKLHSKLTFNTFLLAEKLTPTQRHALGK